MASLVLAAAPVRLWPRLERNFPLRSAAAASGLLTSCIGFAIDIVGTLNVVFANSSARTAMMLGTTTEQGQFAQALADAAPALTLLTFLYFPFLTPLGLFATYLTITGAFRGIAAWFDDPRGDFVLTGVDWAATTILAGNRLKRERLTRERLEGPDAPDVLRTGEWAGLTGIDYLVLAARRKPEWTAGAIILTSSDWYRLGSPFDLQTPAGLRTAYPLTKITTHEVVRRGIQYELPRLTRSKPSPSPSPSPSPKVQNRF
jgi:hypothetical protein